MSSVEPSLDARAVQQWVGPNAFKRGQWYQRQGRVLHPRREGWRLKAWCQGQAREPYRVEVRLTPAGIGEAWCTCPAGRDGRCKHVAAVLLHWLAHPGQFRPASVYRQSLARWPREHLLRLVRAMLARHPDLEDLLPLYAPPSARPSQGPSSRGAGDDG